MKFESEDLAICVTCGTQYDVPLSSPPKTCRICEDPRQYVPPSGHTFSSLAREQPKQKNEFTQDKHDPRIWFISTSADDHDPLRPDFTKSKKPLGIGQRAILIQTPNGNILWDLISFIDAATISFIQSLGGIKAIVISHPHFFTTHLEWAQLFSCPVYINRLDETWLNRSDEHKVRKWVDEKEEIVEGVTAIRVGGHFDGSMVLHFDGALFIADSFMTVPSAYNPTSPLPGTVSYSFMWSYPNMIPLPPAKVRGIWKAIKPYDFTATYGGFKGQNNRAPDLKQRVLESMRIFTTQAAGHEDTFAFEEMA